MCAAADERSWDRGGSVQRTKARLGRRAGSKPPASPSRQGHNADARVIGRPVNMALRVLEDSLDRENRSVAPNLRSGYDRARVQSTTGDLVHRNFCRAGRISCR